MVTFSTKKHTSTLMLPQTFGYFGPQSALKYEFFQLTKWQNELYSMFCKLSSNSTTTLLPRALQQQRARGTLTVQLFLSLSINISDRMFFFLSGCEPKTVNPLDPRQGFCQYWPWGCNLTAEFWFCLVLANHRAGTSINQSDCGSAGSWHPQISQSQSWDHYQPIRFWIRWVSLRQWVWKQTQPLKLSKLPCHGSKGLTVFGPNHEILGKGEVMKWLLPNCLHFPPYISPDIS